RLAFDSLSNYIFLTMGRVGSSNLAQKVDYDQKMDKRSHLMQILHDQLVSMFKRNYDHLPKDTYFGMYEESTRCNPYYFLTYGNGKSVTRIQDHLRPNGAQRWHNYKKTP
ncbi:hypothetical protein UlMin_007940, partial [Ulmus minor]